jgi:hypothetical protein
MATTGGRRSLVAALGPVATPQAQPDGEQPEPGTAPPSAPSGETSAPGAEASVMSAPGALPVSIAPERSPVAEEPAPAALHAVAAPAPVTGPPAQPAPASQPTPVAPAYTAPAPVAAPTVAAPLPPAAEYGYAQAAPQRPVATVRPLPRAQAAGEWDTGEGVGPARRNQRPGKNAFRERKEVFLWEDQLDDLEQIAKRLKRARQGEGEPITANTLIRVAIDLLLQRGGEVSGRSERELLQTLGLRDRDDFGRFTSR